MNVNKVIDINNALRILSKRRKVFASEADFQLEFAWIIKELYPMYKVRLEYVPLFDTTMHIDIAVFLKNKDGEDMIIPIELKYKTKGYVLESEKEKFYLKNHGAKDINCYLYLKDVQRIEKVREKSENFCEGYAIMLTNEQSYKIKPSKVNCIYEAFSIHDGKKIEAGKKLEWSESASKGTIKGIEAPIAFENEYIMKWQKYSNIDDKNGTFWLLINKIS